MTRERTTDDRDEKRMRERLDQDMRKDDERQRSEEAASHLAGRPLSPHPFVTPCFRLNPPPLRYATFIVGLSPTALMSDRREQEVVRGGGKQARERPQLGPGNSLIL